MITSSSDLFAHLASAVEGVDQSHAESHTLELGPLQVKLTLHGSREAADIFEVFPAVRVDLDSNDLPLSEKRVDFAVHIIDGLNCNVERPRLNWHASDFGKKRLMPGWSDNDRTTYILRGEDGLAVADWRLKCAYVWAPSVVALTKYERAAPFRWLIECLAQRHGLITMHAAAIGEDGIGVLIVGEGGRGKSTLALTAISEGMEYVADDYCFIDATPPYRAYRLFNTAKVRVDSRVQPHWIVGLEHQIEPFNGGKRIFNLACHAPAALASRLNIRALLLPKFADDAESVIEAASPSEAFRRAAPSTVAQGESSGAQAAADIGRLTRALPSYRISVPPEPRLAIARIKELIRTLRSLPEDAS